MAIAGPFYFAWVEPTETTFNPSVHNRMDEYIFSAKRTLAEGEKPLLDLEFENPHVGILSSGRKYWAWFSWFDGSSIVPLFFGRVVGTPTAIFDEVIAVQLVTNPDDYKQRVQRAAEALKIPPFYNQVFIDTAHRDDPDTILEAHAKVWDVNHLTMAVTANSIIDGDSNEDFTADDHFYDSMQMTIGQPPATSIFVDASVSWKQTARGVVDVTNGVRRFVTLSGDGLVSDWPKPLQSLGGGYTVYSSDCYDTAGAATSEVVSTSWSYQNKEKEHSDGDTLSINGSYSTPMGGTIWRQGTLTQFIQAGFMDPFAVDVNGDPAPTNIPASVHITTGYVMGWDLSAYLKLQYEAERPRTERVVFLVRANTQPVLVDPLISQDSETLTKSGVDVGVPIINLLNWSSIAGTHVNVGDVIFPDNPDIPGTQSAQRATVAGTAGTVEPEFSSVPGDTTIDGGVTWASLGVAAPTDNASDWTPISHVPAGTIILPKRPFFVSFALLIQPSTHVFPQPATSVSEGQIIQAANGSYQVCTLAGSIPAIPAGGTLPAFSATWGVVTTVGSSEWTSLGMSLTSGTTFFLATTGGTTGALHVSPPFNETLHATTNDNTVVWTAVGTGDIPAGGVPGDVHAASFFTSDRGRPALEYLGACARAKLLWRSRCVGIEFDSDYARGVALTPRKTATLHDPRIAGGLAKGKIKTAVLAVSDSGVAGCHVTLASCAGFANTVEEVAGDPTWVADGYVQDGWQQREGVTRVIPTLSDLGYAPPVYTVTDDGLTFPLTREQIIVIDTYHQGPDVADDALAAMAKAAQLSVTPLAYVTGQPYGAQDPLDAQFFKDRQLQMLQANNLGTMLKNSPSWQEFQLKPASNGPFHAVYNVKFTDLEVPADIDLQSDTLT